MHAPYLLATTAAKGLFWEGCVWWVLLSNVPLLGNSPLFWKRGDVGVKAAFVPQASPPCTPSEPL